MRQPPAQAEEVLRALASAAGAVRLYPPTSDLPAQAIQRFVAVANTVTGRGPLRYAVESQAFYYGDAEMGAGVSQVASLAETLHAHQAGQLVIASGVTEPETRAFLDATNADPYALNRSGGLRAELRRADVDRLLIIEITLLSSDTDNLLGLDLLSAPLSEIGPAAEKAAEVWSSSVGGDAVDQVAQALDPLGAAADLAARRIAEAMLQLDEATRVRIARSALETDGDGKPMEGMLRVIATMDPAALARLLRLAAGDFAAAGVAARLELPPAAARALMLMLEPSARSEREMGVPENVDPDGMADDIALDGHEDSVSLARVVAFADPALAAGRAVRTTVAIAEDRRTEDAVLAVGDALPGALAAGALEDVRDAVARLRELESDLSLATAVAGARRSLADVALLADACGQAAGRVEPDALAEVLGAAGPPGGEAFVNCYLACPDRRPMLAVVARLLGDPVPAAAGRALRTADSPSAIALVGLLGALGDKRVLPALQQALEHLDVEVRRTGVTAVADLPGQEARGALVRLLNHWDPQTRRFAVREIGRVRAEEALPPLQRTLEDITPFERNYELKKEALKALEAIGSARVLPILQRVAGRRLVFSRKRRELRFLARGALQRLAETQAQAEARAGMQDAGPMGAEQ